MKKYSEEFDSYYDEETGEWFTDLCGDKYCMFCKERPAKAPIAVPRSVLDVAKDYNLVIAPAKSLAAAYKEVYKALEQIISIGKRDMSNPKYDGFFETARAALKENIRPYEQ